MKSLQRSLGLVVEGTASSSLILRLPHIGEELGPIKGSALRVARRLSNALRAGYAVNKYEELKPARLVLLRIPDSVVPRVVEELCASDLILKEMSFALCESWLSTSVLKPLQSRGAYTATILPVQTVRKDWFVVEGSISTVRQVRKFLERNGARGFELRSGTKPLYFAAHFLTTTVPLQHFAGAQQALRSAGVCGNHLYELLEEMAIEMFRSFSNGARFDFPGQRSSCAKELGMEYLQRLREDQPQIASMLEEHLYGLSRFRSVKYSRSMPAGKKSPSATLE